MSTVVEAEKLSGCEPPTPLPPNQAVSVRVSWESVANVNGISIPLRRPKKPALRLAADDARAALEALKGNVEGDASYDEFRKELGL